MLQNPFKIYAKIEVQKKHEKLGSGSIELGPNFGRILQKNNKCNIKKTSKNETEQMLVMTPKSFQNLAKKPFKNSSKTLHISTLEKER
jgi:hypothetical protein